MWNDNAMVRNNFGQDCGYIYSSWYHKRQKVSHYAARWSLSNYHLSVLGTIRIEDLIFMQDRAPPYFALAVREWLNAQYPGKRMSRRGSHEWPVKSPGLTVNVLRLCLWGCLREQVYSTKSRYLEKLVGRIREVLTSIPQELLVKSVDAVHGWLWEAGGEWWCPFLILNKNQCSKVSFLSKKISCNILSTHFN